MNEKTTLVTTRRSAVAPWADRQDVRELAERLQAMIPGGSKLSPVEALTLAQAAVAHGLDPLNGELWFLKDRDGKPLGLMAGIKGHRRAAHLQMKADGGGNYWPEFDMLTDDEKAALGIPPTALAYRCKIRDTQTVNQYVGEIERLTKLDLPWEVVSSIVGKKPYTEGIGYAEKTERSKMTLVQRAMKRAEADALKRRFDLPFGMGIGTAGDTDTDIVAGEFTVVKEAVIPQKTVEKAAEDIPMENGRPYSPAKVRQAVRQRGEWLKGEADDWSDAKRQPDDEQVGPVKQEIQRVAAMIGAAFKEGKDDSRHIILSYLFGQNSTKLLTDAEVKACLTWLEAESGSWIPSGAAADECRQILAAQSN